MRIVARLSALLILLPTLMSAKEAFPPTAPGVNEVKTLPAGILLRSESTDGSSYFNQSNSLFRPLFRYIDSRSIAMTTPVEARVEPGQMFFWVAENEKDKVNGDAPGVKVIEVAERLVASRGGRGSYSEDNFTETSRELIEWLAGQPEFVKDGDPYPVYWNGPFTPGFLKRYEVHIPVIRR